MSRKMRMTQVARVEDLSPHMKRIVLTGTDLNDFPVDHESAHVKAIFPKPNEDKPTLGMYLGAKKWMRSYTVRFFNEETKELTIDFAVNDHSGLATDWAANAQPNDYLGIAGPGDTKHPSNHAAWHLIVADLTALPAAAAVLEQLPRDALGHAVIQVPSNGDIQNIVSPEGIQLQWVINPDLKENKLLETVKTLTWLTGTPAIFIAAESAHMRAIKSYVKTAPTYQSALTYASGYWRAS